METTDSSQTAEAADSSLMSETAVSPRLGKDELNFVEYPIALLADRPNPALKTLQFTQLISGRNGKVHEAKWAVTGSDKEGLPLAGDEDIFLVLIDLTKEAGFKDRTIYFSRYEVIRRLKGGDVIPSGADYERIKAALSRLLGVNIEADRWYDKSSRRYISVGFHILEKYELVEETPGRKKSVQPPLRLSYITWSETVFANFRHGYLKSLDLDRYFSLRSPIARRLYRLLDKRFYDGKPCFESLLRPLAHEHLGLSRKYAYDAHLKAKMKKAHEELVAAGCIEGYDYREGKEGLVVIYYPPGLSARTPPAPPLPSAAPEVASEGSPPSSPAGPPPADARPEYVSEGARRLVEEFGFDRATAEGFAQDPETGDAVILEQIGFLPLRNPGKNAAGLLRRAIEGKWAPPDSYLKAKEAQEKEAARRRKRKAREPQEAESGEASSQERDFEAVWTALTEAKRSELAAAAETLARERHPIAAKSAEKGRGKKAWKDLVRIELTRLALALADSR